MQVLSRSPRVRRYSVMRPSNGLSGTTRSIPVNIKEFDNHFGMQLAIPGFSKEQITIEFKEGDKLIIKGVANKTSEAGKFHQREFVPRSFEKEFTIGESIDKNGITASFEQGVLLVDLQKKKEARKAAPRTIEVF